VTSPDGISTGLRLASLSLPYTHICIFIDLSCHAVCFSGGFLLRFWHSLHISSHSMIFFLSFFVLLSFCTFRILEYLLIGIFSWDIVHGKPIMSVSWVDLDFCLMNCCIAYIFLWLSFDSCHKCNIIFGTNRIWFFFVMVFLKIFLFNLGSGICHPVAPSIVFNRWIFWKTDSYWSHLFIFPKVSSFRWAFPPLMQSLP